MAAEASPPPDANSSFTIRWMSFVSALFHLQLFLVTSISLILLYRDPTMELGRIMFWVRYIDGGVALAYIWDIICINRGVVPFSRCRKGSEIVAHHAPVIFFFLPMALPLVMRSSWAEPMIGISNKLDERVLRLYLQGNGWGFISSLNEFIMCMQRVEMSHMQFDPRSCFWNSKSIQFLELIFKVGIFTTFSSISCFKSCQIDVIVWQLLSSTNPTSSIFDLFIMTYKSPIQLRTIAWRLFAITNYPKMAKRTLDKLGALSQDTAGDTKLQ
jgi:hypothetical protein